MKTCLALLLLLFGGACFAQAPPGGRPQAEAAYPESEAAAAWRALASSYIRRAQKEQTLVQDPLLNARVDTVMAAVGAAAAALDGRYAGASWKAILIEDFGRGAAAFPGEIILVDAKFVRALQLDDNELALVFSHEVAHVIAGHALAKLSFMADYLGKDKIPTARKALLEFLAKDAYAAVYQPTALLQEREADRLGAAIFFASGFQAERALGLFDKLAARESREDERATDSHDSARVRKQAIAGVLADLRQLDSRRARAAR